jgi:hypothetical protein
MRSCLILESDASDEESAAALIAARRCALLRLVSAEDEARRSARAALSAAARSKMAPNLRDVAVLDSDLIKPISTRCSARDRRRLSAILRRRQPAAHVGEARVREARRRADG